MAGRRQRLKGPGILEHRNPIPAAVRVGKLVCSSAIGGDDPGTHEIPEDKTEEIGNAFSCVRRIMEEAGGTPDDIAKMTVYLRDKSDRSLVNPFWLEMFPDEDDRPARHTVQADLPPGRSIQLEIMAMLE